MNKVPKIQAKKKRKKNYSTKKIKGLCTTLNSEYAVFFVIHLSPF